MDSAIERELRVRLPEWIPGWLEARDAPLATRDDRMHLVIELARANVEHGTGGPFAAAVYALDSGTLLSVGVNVVVAQHCSVAHAEILALGLAQARVGSHSLASPQGGRCELISSAEPCAMCLGAVAWSGIAALVIGARDADVREIGFDEGHKPRDWRHALAARGIAVTCDVLREDACAVLTSYAASGGPIYNG